MKQYKVYLAGPITGLSYKACNYWREYATKFLNHPNIQTLNPMRGKEYLSRYRKLKDQYIDIHPLTTAHSIVSRDSWDCRRSDLVLVNFLDAKIVSIGTVLEIAWAQAAGVYVVVVMEKNNIHRHAMLEGTASLVLEKLDEALDLIPTILGI